MCSKHPLRNNHGGCLLKRKFFLFFVERRIIKNKEFLTWESRIPTQAGTVRETGMVQLLLADSDKRTQEQIRAGVEKHGYELDTAESGIAAMKLLRRKEYDILLTELELPELDGINVCRQVRKASGIPVIFLSPKSREIDKMKAFDAGADDYVVKPFFTSELMARVHVFLERAGSSGKQAALFCGGISVYLNAKEAYVDGRLIELSPREYALLVLLMENQNIVLSRDVILDEVWGRDYEGTDRTVDSHIKSLRSHIQPYRQYINTVWGIGYKLCQM